MIYRTLLPFAVLGLTFGFIISWWYSIPIFHSILICIWAAATTILFAPIE
jgi:hypothetical protein